MVASSKVDFLVAEKRINLAKVSKKKIVQDYRNETNAASMILIDY